MLAKFYGYTVLRLSLIEILLPTKLSTRLSEQKKNQLVQTLCSVYYCVVRVRRDCWRRSHNCNSWKVRGRNIAWT